MNSEKSLVPSGTRSLGNADLTNKLLHNPSHKTQMENSLNLPKGEKRCNANNLE